MDFRQTRVLITGASRGIGAAIARAFASEGGSVVVNYRERVAEAEACAEACRQAGGDAVAVQADVTRPEQVRALLAEAELAFGGIDVLVHNAFSPYRFVPEERRPAWELPWSDLQAQIDGSVRAAHGLIQAVLPGLFEQGGGSIILLASNLVDRPVVPYHDYITAKAALVGYGRSLARELGNYGVRVNLVCPGLVYPTDASRDGRVSQREALAAQTPLQRLATPEDVTGPVLFLASPWARFMTGQVLTVDGGL